MENERKKKFQDYAPPEQKPSGGYNLNGVYYSRDGQRLDDQPKKSWSQREYERAEREKIHCRAKREQGESEVDAQGNPIRDNSGVKKAIAIVVIVLGVIASIALPGSATWAVIFAIVTLISAGKQKQSYDAGDWERFRTSAKKATRWLWVTLGLCCVGVVAIFGIVGMYLKSDNGAVDLIREAIQTIRDDDSSHTSENSHKDAEADSKSKTPDGKFKNLKGENVSYVHGFNTFALAGNEFSIPCKFSEFEKAGFTIRNDEEKKIKPGESDGYAYYEEDGTYRGTIFIFNTSDKDIVPEKGIVGGLTLNPGSPVGKNDLKLVGDLGFESQPDDFGQVLGYQLTNYVSMSNYTSYEWYFEDEGYYTSLQAQYGEDGKLSTVWLMNNADLRN